MKGIHYIIVLTKKIGRYGLSIPISLSDLVPGKNTLELKATGEEDFVAANISLELDLTLAGGQNKYFFPLQILK
jgi:hypothetical protein